MHCECQRGISQSWRRSSTSNPISIVFRPFDPSAPFLNRTRFIVVSGEPQNAH
jgi:hypothetical protein